MFMQRAKGINTAAQPEPFDDVAPENSPHDHPREFRQKGNIGEVPSLTRKASGACRVQIKRSLHSQKTLAEAVEQNKQNKQGNLLLAQVFAQDFQNRKPLMPHRFILRNPRDHKIIVNGQGDEDHSRQRKGHGEAEMKA